MCYLVRADRGDRLAEVRLAGEGGVEARAISGSAGDALGVAEAIRDAAGWIAERLEQGEGPRASLRMVCLDVDGARCEWVTAPGVDEPVVAAALGQGEAMGEGLAPMRSTGLWAPPSLEESTVQALAGGPEPTGGGDSAGGAPAGGLASAVKGRLRRRSGRGVASAGAAEDAGAGQRLAVLAVPDVAARLLLDELDDREVPTSQVATLWHAMAIAWDPGAKASAAAADRAGNEVVIEVAGPASAIVLVDPAGRLVWCWSRAGELVAAGSMRLAVAKPAGEGDAAGVTVGRADLGRLAAEWLGWAAQVGVAPGRVVCVVPSTGVGARSDDDLSPVEIGEAMGLAWPGATIDLAVHDEPIDATLVRVARLDAAPSSAAADRQRSLVRLTHRPGRAHQSMYRWVAAALGAGALALGVVAVKAWSQAGAARAQVAKVKEETSSRVVPRAGNALQQELARGRPVQFVQDKLAEMRSKLDPAAGLDKLKPVLAEMTALSFVIGTREIELKTLDVSQLSVQIELIVPDTQTAEAVIESLRSAPDSLCDWSQQISKVGGSERVSVQLLGTWKRAPGGAK